MGRTDAEAEVPIPWPPDMKNWLTGKDADTGKNWGQEEKAVTEDQMVGWHHWLNRHEFEQTPGDSEGQGSVHDAVYCITKNWTWLNTWTTTFNWKQTCILWLFQSRELFPTHVHITTHVMSICSLVSKNCVVIAASLPSETMSTMLIVSMT